MNIPVAGVCRPRHPERTALYRVMFHHFERFLAECESRFEREYGFLRPNMCRDCCRARGGVVRPDNGCAAAFDAAFSGEGEVIRGQLVVLKQGEKGSTPARPELENLFFQGLEHQNWLEANKMSGKFAVEGPRGTRINTRKRLKLVLGFCLMLFVTGTDQGHNVTMLSHLSLCILNENNR